MKVWVLVKKNRLNTLHSKRFEEEAALMGIELMHVRAEDFEIVEPSDQARKVWYQGEYVDIPDVLITRIMGMSYFSYALIRLLSTMGVHVMNSALSIELAEDKLRTIQILSANNLPIPKSILAKFPVDIDFISNKLGFPLIMKTVLGSKGEGVLLFENKNQFKDVSYILHKTSEGKTNLIFQEYISDSFSRDVRVFVVGDKAVGAAIRKGAEGQFKANVSAGGSADYFELSPELADLAVRASKSLGLSISGVDFLFDKGKFLIAEVNSTPSFTGFERVSKVNVPRHILEYAVSVKRP